MTKKFLILTTLFLVACATEEKKEEPKVYSQETNQAFEMIERGGSYYLKKAPNRTTPPQVEAPTPKRVAKQAPLPPIKKESETVVIDENINYQEKPMQKEVKSSPQKHAKVDERLVEINQNLAFYCMKNRNLPAWGGDEDKCLKHVEKIQKNCQKKFSKVDNKLLACIKGGLKK